MRVRSCTDASCSYQRARCCIARPDAPTPPRFRYRRQAAPQAARPARLRRGGSGCLHSRGACARPSRPLFRIDKRRVDDHPRPVEPLGPGEIRLQHDERPLEQAAASPLLEPTPTRLTTGQAELPIRHLQPGRIGEQHEQDPLQTRTRRPATTTRITEPTRRIRKQRLQPLPQLVRHPPLQRLRTPHTTTRRST